MIDHLQMLLNTLATGRTPIISAARRNNDQLLRALVPLYLLWKARRPQGETMPRPINSGDMRRFWEARGVRISSSNLARACREHVGYSRRVRRARDGLLGIVITPNGVKYVEAAR
jgi:hypothetical protein